MVTRLFLIFFSFISLGAVSQIDTLRLDSNVLTIQDTGRVIVLTTVIHHLSGGINGDFKGKAIYSFHHGKKNGKSTIYWHNGEKYLEENYTEGQRNGESRLFGLNGDLENYHFYKNGVVTTSIVYYSNGIKHLESIKDSNNVSYYYVRLETGQIKSSTLIYNDSTVSINYYDNGKIKDKDVLSTKTRIHNAKLWDRKGVLLKEKYFIIDGVYNDPLHPKETIYEPELIKKNEEYRNW